MGFGSAAIFARIGMSKFNPLPATFISSVASLVPLMILALIFAIDDFKSLPALAYLFFLGHGALTFVGGRMQNLLSIKLIGAARSGPFVGSAALFSALFATTLMGEELGLLIGIGTFFVVIGLAGSTGDLLGNQWRIDKRSLLGYTFGLGAAACYGGSNLAAKALSLEYGSPLVVAAMGVLFGSLLLGFCSGKQTFTSIVSDRRGVMFLTFSGWSAAIAVVSLYYAFTMSDVVIISPIAAINPLITILLAQLFLSRIEKVSLAVFLGAMLAVVGVILVIIGGSL